MDLQTHSQLSHKAYELLCARNFTVFTSLKSHFDGVELKLIDLMVLPKSFLSFIVDTLSPPEPGDATPEPLPIADESQSLKEKHQKIAQLKHRLKQLKLNKQSAEFQQRVRLLILQKLVQ